MNHPDRTRGADEREIEEALLDAEMDADFGLISDYAAGFLDAETAERVAARLQTDPDFADRAAPVLLAWEAPPRLEPLSQQELLRSWLRLRRRAAMPALEMGDADATAHDLGGYLRRKQAVADTKKVERRILFAASFALLMLVPVGLMLWMGDVPPPAPATPVEIVSAAPGSLRLPDGSRVELGAGTRIRHAGNFTDARVLYMEGRATLTVVAGKGTFTVATPAAEIVVEGTKFAVNATASETRIEVTEGRVVVRARSDDPTKPRPELALAAGEKARATRNGSVERIP